MKVRQGRCERCGKKAFLLNKTLYGKDWLICRPCLDSLRRAEREGKRPGIPHLVL